MTQSNSWTNAVLGLVFSVARAAETFVGFTRRWRTKKVSANTSKKTGDAKSTKTDRTSAE